MCDDIQTKKPYLWYYEEAENAWIPLPERFSEVIEANQLFDREEFEIKIRRQDMTQAEFDKIPEG